MNTLINAARHIPINAAVQTVSINTVTLSVPGRTQPLEMRITAPARGSDLPILALSHGAGPSLYLSSKDGYGPLVNFYAEHGFVVIQPTHANSKVGGLGPDDAPDAPLFWRTRAQEITCILDQLDTIEAQVPAIAGRFDRDRIAAVGHSLGGHTVNMLLGARLTEQTDAGAMEVDLIEPRIKAGVLLAAPGRGGDSLSDDGRKYWFFDLDFSRMTTRALVVLGDDDASRHLTVRGAQWHADAYHDSPASDGLLTLFGAKHGLGGVAGFDAKETNDEDPDRLAVTQRMTWAYLRSALYDGDPAWSDACKALEKHAGSQGRVDTKQLIRPK